MVCLFFLLMSDKSKNRPHPYRQNDNIWHLDTCHIFFLAMQVHWNLLIIDDIYDKNTIFIFDSVGHSDDYINLKDEKSLIDYIQKDNEYNQKILHLQEFSSYQIKMYKEFVYDYQKVFEDFIRVVYNNIVYLYIIDGYGIYKLEFNTNDSPKSVSKVKSATISTPIYNAHYVISNNVDYIYIITETKYYKYDINSNNLNDPVYTYEDISTQSTHTYKYSLVDNNTIYFKYEGINKIYYLDDGQNPNIKIFTNATVEDPSTPRFNFEVCSFNIINNIIYFILEQYENNIYSYVFFDYTINTNKETYGYNLDDNSFKLANPYNSSIPLVKSNSSIILIDDNSTIANRYPVSFIKIQPIVFTKNAIHLFHNMFISENICRVRSVPETDFDIVNKKYVDDLISDIGQNIHSINLLVNNNNENRNLNQPLLLTTNENYNGTFSITWIVNNTEIIETYDFCQLINYTKSNVNISIFNAANIKTPNNSLNKVLFIKEFNINNNVYKCVIDDDTSGLINGLKYVNNKVKIPYLINIVNNNDNVELHYDYNEQYESRIINSNEKWLLQFNNIILKKK